ncbi:MAG: hypothetical protein AAFQ66_17715 [Pseudomonadota bacterium]
MNLIASHQKLCPNLTKILKKDIPAVRGNRKVFRALVKNGAVKDKDMRNYLSFGTGPNIKISQTSTVPLSASTARTFGVTPNNSAKTGIIRLDRLLVTFLEVPFGPKHSPVPKEPVKTALRELRAFIILTLLHELVHFARNDAREPEDIEYGWKFEKDAGLISKFPMFFTKPHSIEDSPVWMALPTEPPFVR